MTMKAPRLIVNAIGGTRDSVITLSDRRSALSAQPQYTETLPPGASVSAGVVLLVACPITSHRLVVILVLMYPESRESGVEIS